MIKEQFSIKEAFSYSWDTFKKNWRLFLAISIINLFLSVPLSIIDRYPSTPILNLIFVLSAVLSLLVVIGKLKVILRVYDNEDTKISDIFRYSRYFWRFLAVCILYQLLVIVGLILFVVPGFIWAIKYSMTLNLIVDKDAGIMDSFRKSAELTDGVKWRLFIFGLASFGVIILGTIALGVGILVAGPITWIADVYVYRHLVTQKGLSSGK